MQLESPVGSPARLFPIAASPLPSLLRSPLAEPVLTRALASPAMKSLEKVRAAPSNRVQVNSHNSFFSPEAYRA